MATTIQPSESDCKYLTGKLKQTNIVTILGFIEFNNSKDVTFNYHKAPWATSANIYLTLINYIYRNIPKKFFFRLTFLCKINVLP